MANERLKKLRELMERDGLDAYYVPSSDFHDSEYVEAYFRCREFLSGFTGSAGTLIVTRDFAGLWTDGRYFVQARAELAGQEIELMRMGDEGVPGEIDFLKSHVPAGGVLGLDGRVVNAGTGMEIARALAENGARISAGHDLAGEIWTDRPALAAPKVWILKERYSGESADSKIKRLREAIAAVGAAIHILSSLDDIAWLFNIRKTGADGNFLPPAHVLVSQDEVRLFIDAGQADGQIKRYFDDLGVSVEDYGKIYGAVSALRNKKILLEPGKVNFALFNGIDESCALIERMNPTSLMKAVKNEVERENMRSVHKKDGVALTRFIFWLKNRVASGAALTETEAAERLEEFRKEQDGYLAPSFETISAYGSNAAMCHYHAEEGADAAIGARGFYLVDSGGQYYEGTTDVTRTVVLGPLRPEEKRDYTLVLMGMLRLSNAKFLYGCRGLNLDILARGPLWQYGLDFNHGTGHGVGYLSTVHERPNGFRWRMVPERLDSCVLEEGMVTSNEPGIYIEGSHGIRTENLLLCRKAERNEYGQFMEFETLTLAPIDTEAIELSLMEPSDIRLLNGYHRRVYEELSPYLTEQERGWLREATREIGKSMKA